jgi:hypothetical protein
VDGLRKSNPWTKQRFEKRFGFELALLYVFHGKPSDAQFWYVIAELSLKIRNSGNLINSNDLAIIGEIILVNTPYSQKVNVEQNVCSLLFSSKMST